MGPQIAGWLWQLRRERCALLSSLLVISTVSAALAQPSPGWLEVHDDDRCVRREALEASTVRYLEGAAPSGAIHIDVYIVGQGARVSVTAEGRPTAQRSFPTLPADCELRLQALGLSLALAIESVGAGRVVQSSEPEDEDASGGGDARGGEATSVSEDTSAQAAPATTDRDTAEQSGEEGVLATLEEAAAEQDTAPAAPATAGSSRLVLAPGLAIGSGLLVSVQPEVALAFQLGAELALDAWSLVLAALWSPELDSELAVGRTRTELYAGRLAGCLSQPLGPLRAAACLGVLGGALRAEGIGFDREASDTIPWLATALGVSLRLPSDSAFGLRLRLDAQQNIVQPALRVTGEGGALQAVGVVGMSAFVELHWSAR